MSGSPLLLCSNKQKSINLVCPVMLHSHCESTFFDGPLSIPLLCLYPLSTTSAYKLSGTRWPTPHTLLSAFQSFRCAPCQIVKNPRA